jgi:hypothetical protein
LKPFEEVLDPGPYLCLASFMALAALSTSIIMARWKCAHGADVAMIL